MSEVLSTPRGDVQVVRAARDDLPAVLRVQHRAFARVARAYDLPAEEFPPIREDLASLHRLFDDGWLFLAAFGPGRELVGSVRAEQRADGIVEIGRLVVDDGWEGLGIGKALMTAVEAAYPEVDRFELFTGAEAHGPVHLYGVLGYETHRSETVGPGIELIWMHKRREAR